MAHRCFGEQGQGGVVVHFARRHKHAAMAVAHVFAQADVSDDVKLGPAVLEQTHGLLHDAVFGVSAGGVFVLEFGNAEKNDGFQARIHGLFHLLFQLCKAELELAGHGAYFFTKTLVVSFHNEIGHDAVFNQKGRGFAY